MFRKWNKKLLTKVKGKKKKNYEVEKNNNDFFGEVKFQQKFKSSQTYTIKLCISKRLSRKWWGEDYYRPKRTIDNYQRNTALFITIGQHWSIQNIEKVYSTWVRMPDSVWNVTWTLLHFHTHPECVCTETWQSNG